MTGGPDAVRYLALAQGVKVPRPFHLRWLLPKVCNVSPVRWWIVWLTSWPMMAAGFAWWQWDHGWKVALFGAVLLCGLPGILGPSAVIPVGVDLPATALTLASAACYAHDVRVGALALLILATCIRETSPAWLALWLWSPLPLVVLPVVLIRHFTCKTGPDPLGPQFDEIAEHPVKAALEAHRGQWRNGWLLVFPWAACLLGLYQPSVALVVTLVLAYLQLLIATDTVRLLHHGAGPPMAAAAALLIPAPFMVLVAVGHVFWWRHVERI